jgi:hypothetical protein
MNLAEIINALGLKLLTEQKSFENTIPSQGYASDLLSCVMTGAKQNGLWVTLQSHGNIVAVAALLDLSAIIITENSQPDSATIAKANEQDIVLLLTEKSTFMTVGQLWELGLKA